MTSFAALASVGALIVLATVLGLIWRGRQGRISTGKSTVVTAADVSSPAPFGTAGTLLQFSTELCARCPATGRLLATVAQAHPGVEHVDVDLTHRPDLARRFTVMQTPTTLILDGTGRVSARIGGPPRRADVVEHLARMLDTTTVPTTPTIPTIPATC